MYPTEFREPLIVVKALEAFLMWGWRGCGCICLCLGWGMLGGLGRLGCVHAKSRLERAGRGGAVVLMLVKY